LCVLFFYRMENNSSSRDKQTSVNICHDRYHTVSIRNDLPNIPKYYQEEPLQYLPPNDFWMKKLNPSDSSDTTQRYEIQYSTINGPCKFIEFQIDRDHFYEVIFQIPQFVVVILFLLLSFVHTTLMKILFYHQMIYGY
jgi:hypothetical protein